MDGMFFQNYNQLKTDVFGCSLCGDFEHADQFHATNPVKLLILSRDPMDTGSKGRELLINLMNAHGFKKEDYMFSSVVKCKGTDSSLEVCKNCRRHLATEFKALGAKIVVLLGANSYEAFFGKHPDGNKVRGVISDLNGFKIMTTCNPELCLDNLKLKTLLYEDMGEIKKLM